MGAQIGDRVRVRERFGIARAGDVGTVGGFSAGDKGASNPLVDLPRGRALVPERLLEPAEHGPPPERATNACVPLGDELPPLAVSEAAPPPPDWCERPAVAIRIPAPVWKPKEEKEEKEEAVVDMRTGVKACAESGCDRPVIAKGLCTKHYARMRAEAQRQVRAEEPEADVATFKGPADMSQESSPVPATEPGNPNAPETALSRDLSGLASPPLAGMRDELAASVAALRRAGASALIEGAPIEHVAGIVAVVEHVERLAGEVA